MNDTDSTQTHQSTQPARTFDRATGLRGLGVVATKEGKWLGKVTHVFFDRGSKKLSGLAIREDFWSRSLQWIPAADIKNVGEEIVFIESESSQQSLKTPDEAKGISVRDLQGNWVTTQDGTHLGQLLDINFSSANDAIHEILLSENKYIEVDANDLVIGTDELILPASYLSNVKSLEQRRSGILSRVLGEDTAEQISETVNRGLKQTKAAFEGGKGEATSDKEKQARSDKKEQS